MVAESQRGKFIVLEGCDGCGKSTQARLLAETLDALLTREPGGTAVGGRIREIVLDPAFPELCDQTEALLMAADRAQHVAEKIQPALKSGRHVVSDRFTPSSMAYQGIGRGLGADRIKELNDWATDFLSPDLIVLLEVDVDLAIARLGSKFDRIEATGRDLMESVCDSYDQFADDQPELWVRVNGSGTPDEVASDIAAVVQERLGLG